MLAFLKENLATIIISAVILTAVVLIIIKMRKDKKAGKSCSGCGSGCGSCPSSSMCHK
ncbi:FeoB-associated Cys-rich membrane protein [Ruminiclostridium herbifermentans]|uniref:FeoB-associated Cys-rich membrane protein n=1 Tax=Ruminiclostridium herbifermentans TaxID=2488810 RepID=A0A4U7JKP2_9FIRM|nr:FeoB-associated Cys-rich membrane protein [Ruminiclostridium herbifermentans]QNU67058.1 FeoB-associated Cys-rich membrane protein [Ruminiclostridium herbifermentans]